MSWTARDIPDQGAKIAVVTGANGGLGLEATRELARKGAHVVMAVRNLQKAERAHAELMSEIPTASLEILRLDLGSPSRFANSWRKSARRTRASTS